MQMQTDAPVYYAQAGNNLPIRPEEVVNLTKAFRAARTAYERAEATFAGAFFAVLFMQRPYLDSLKLSFSPSAESDDSGGSFRSVSIGISDVKVIAGFEIPEYLMGQNGLFDADAIGAEIEQEVEDCPAEDMYMCFETDTGCYDDIELQIERSRIADLLKQERVNGLEAYVKLFPDFISQVQEVA